MSPSSRKRHHVLYGHPAGRGGQSSLECETPPPWRAGYRREDRNTRGPAIRYPQDLGSVSHDPNGGIRYRGTAHRIVHYGRPPLSLSATPQYHQPPPRTMAQRTTVRL